MMQDAQNHNGIISNPVEDAMALVGHCADIRSNLRQGVADQRKVGKLAKCPLEALHVCFSRLLSKASGAELVDVYQIGFGGIRKPDLSHAWLGGAR